MKKVISSEPHGGGFPKILNHSVVYFPDMSYFPLTFPREDLGLLGLRESGVRRGWSRERRLLMDWTKSGKEVQVSFVLTGNLVGGGGRKEEGMSKISQEQCWLCGQTASHISCAASPASLCLFCEQTVKASRLEKHLD